ncbi:MAG: transposase [Planctomycetota bacterium]
MVFHVLNRGVGRMQLFSKPGDYLAFEELLGETRALRPMRICAYVLMPNHWHLVLWPKEDGQLASFMQMLTTRHVRRWQLHRGKVGYGHVYQSRYKSFPVQRDRHFYQVARYVERNPLRAGLVDRAEAWQWSSLWRRAHSKPDAPVLLDPWPVEYPSDWLTIVHEPQSEAELEALRRSVHRGQPYGSHPWIQKTAKRLGLESSLRAPHRPRKAET